LYNYSRQASTQGTCTENAVKFGTVLFRCASGQTHRQTDRQTGRHTYRHADRNSSDAYQWQNNQLLYRNANYEKNPLSVHHISFSSSLAGTE